MHLLDREDKIWLLDWFDSAVNQCFVQVKNQGKIAVVGWWQAQLVLLSDKMVIWQMGDEVIWVEHVFIFFFLHIF